MHDPHDASATLKTLTTAQADFRTNDRDGNGRNDYWRKDVAGLCFLVAGKDPIRLIEVSMATADACPVIPPDRDYGPSQPKSGFRFKALRFVNESTPDPDRWAACAYPAPYEKGRQGTYIVDHTNIVYKKDLGPQGRIEAYPVSPSHEGWERID